MKLSKRLKVIAEMIDYSTVADVGSDHGKLIMHLVNNNLAKKGYAIENKIGPFNRLKKAISDNNNPNIIPVYEDGITNLNKEVDTVVIAGMGGITIVGILNAHPERLKNVKTIVVDAHSASNKVRETLSTLNYKIIKEELIKEDDLYYEIIKANKCNDEVKLSTLELEFGPLLLKEKSSLFIEKYNNELESINKLLDKSDLPDNRRKDLTNRKELILTVLN